MNLVRYITMLCIYVEFMYVIVSAFKIQHQQDNDALCDICFYTLKLRRRPMAT